MRLALTRVLPTALLLGLVGLPALPASAADSSTTVTIVTRTTDGSLDFRSERVSRAQAKSRALRWRGQPGVVAADVEHRLTVAATPDPLRPQQWGLDQLRATEIRAAGGAAGQVVAVIDSGVDGAHPDLIGALLPGTDLVTGGGNGWSDPNGHGTHVAGVIAAAEGNGIGGAGLASDAKVLPVRVIGADGSGTDGDTAEGIVWAVDHGATVINLSIGGPDTSSVMESAVRYAIQRGVAVVAASGNDGERGDPINYPAASPSVIAVGAVDQAGVRPTWSSTGSHLSVVAPGVGIVSTVPGGYASWSGTSMATPFVAAAAAVLRRAQPQLSPTGIRDRLRSTAVDLGPAGFDAQYGSGRINLYDALGLPSAPPAPPAAPAPVAPAPAPAAPAPVEPAPVPAAPAPVAPAPAPAAPAPAPAAPAPVAPAPAPAPVPAPVPSPPSAELSQPTPLVPVLPEPPAVAPSAPAVQGPPPVATIRISSSSTLVRYRAPVRVSARTLTATGLAPGTPVRLERLIGGRWVLTRTGTTGSVGLIDWVLRPDVTTSYRIRSGTVTSPLRKIAVRR